MLLPVMIAYAVVLLFIVASHLWKSAESPTLQLSNIAVFCVWSAAFGASVALMAAMNNANTLIRVYSRMVSACYIGFTMLTMIWTDTMAMLAQLSVITAIFLLFQTYRETECTGTIFYGYMLLGIATVIEPVLVIVILLLWVSMFSTIVVLTFRLIVASLVGFVWTWCMMAVWQLAMGNIAEWWYSVVAEWERLVVTDFFSYAPDQRLLLIATGYVVFFASLGTLHFFVNSSADKVHTRQIYEFFTVVHVCLLLLMALRPDMIATVLPFYIIVAAPLVGHYFALTNSRFMNVFFIISILVGLVLTLYNLWIGYLS